MILFQIFVAAAFGRETLWKEEELHIGNKAVFSKNDVITGKGINDAASLFSRLNIVKFSDIGTYFQTYFSWSVVNREVSFANQILFSYI